MNKLYRDHFGDPDLESRQRLHDEIAALEADVAKVKVRGDEDLEAKTERVERAREELERTRNGHRKEIRRAMEELLGEQEVFFILVEEEQCQDESDDECQIMEVFFPGSN